MDIKKSKENIKSYESPIKTFHFKCSIRKCWEEEVALNKSLGDDTKTTERFMETVVSGLKEDRDGDRMSQKAIDGMIMQYKSGIIPFFPDHGRDEKTGEPFVYSWKQMMGVWVDGKQEGDHLVATLRLNKFHQDHETFWNYVHHAKMPIGFSIGGKTSEPKEIGVEG